MLENNRQNYKGKEYCSIHEKNDETITFAGKKGGIITAKREFVYNLEDMQ